MTAEILISIMSNIILLISIIVSSFLIRKQMIMSYSLHLRTQSLEYSVYSDKHLQEAKINLEKKFGNLFDLEESIPLKKILKDDEVLSSVLTLLAHWENMALAIAAGVADNRVCQGMVARTMLQHMKVLYNFINHRRRNDKRIYMHLVQLEKKWDEELGNITPVEYASIFESYK